MRDFLDDIVLTPEERERLRALAAGDARALHAMYVAAPRDFAAYFGPTTAALVAQLEAVAGPVPGVPAAPPFALGSALGPAPVHQSAPRDLALRDRLFARLEELGAAPVSPERDRAIAELEARLNALLDG